jgi:hypothetical protein
MRHTTRITICSLAATLMLIAAPLTLAAGTEAPSQLDGMWEYVYPDGTIQHVLIDASTIRIFVNGNDQAAGPLSVSGDTITLYPTNRCDGTGVYQWSVSGGTLRFMLVSHDPCRRAQLLPSVPWNRP